LYDYRRFIVGGVITFFGFGLLQLIFLALMVLHLGIYFEHWTHYEFSNHCGRNKRDEHLRRDSALVISIMILSALVDHVIYHLRSAFATDSDSNMTFGT
jgi:hypothetical protein